MQWLDDQIEGLKKMPLDRLQRESLQIQTELVSIKDQIDRASLRRREGEEVDRDWFRRVQKARRVKGILHQAIAKEMGNRRKEEALGGSDLEDSARFERYFFNVAKEILPSELFQKLVEEAIEECRADHGEQGRIKARSRAK